MSPVGGIWAPTALRVLREVALSTTKMLRSKIAAATRPLNAELQPVAVRSAPPSRQPVHPAALLRQQKRGNWHSTNSTSSYYDNLHAAVRRYLSSTSGPTAGRGSRFDRSKFPVSNTSRAVSQLTGRAPFASTLRPNLTGGAMPRTAGGYSVSGAGRVGGQRYFSHTPTAPAQVVQNVSQAMRAFWLSGQRARFDGEVGPNGQRRFRAVNAAQDEARIRMSNGLLHMNAPGSYIEFRISPSVTALSPLAAAAFGGFESKVSPTTLNAEGFLDALSVDFARALKDLAAVMSDIKKLAALGDLPISLENKSNPVLRVRFPGVDADTVERLCDDIGVQRGLVGQDPEFDASAGVWLALRFPFAPDATVAKSITSPGGSMRSHNSALSLEEDADDDAFLDELDENPWLLPSPEPESYASLSAPTHSSSGEHCSEDFEGLEGIYRFLEECGRAKSRY